MQLSMEITSLLVHIRFLAMSIPRFNMTGGLRRKVVLYKHVTVSLLVSHGETKNV